MSALSDVSSTSLSVPKTSLNKPKAYNRNIMLLLEITFYDLIGTLFTRVILEFPFYIFVSLFFLFSVARCPLPVGPMPISFSKFRVHRYHGLLLERRYIIKPGHA